MNRLPSNPDSRNAHVRLADLNEPADQQNLVMLLDAYAASLTGGDAKLPEAVVSELIPGLQAHPTTVVFLAEVNSQSVGLAICFVGFSTFKAKPLINIHDLAVHPDYRNGGVGSTLIESICRHARRQNYCAVTLEVQANNPARRLYARYGFEVSTPTNDRTMLFGKLEIEPT